MTTDISKVSYFFLCSSKSFLNSKVSNEISCKSVSYKNIFVVSVIVVLISGNSALFPF